MLLSLHGATITVGGSPSSEGMQPSVYIETPIVIIFTHGKSYERG